MSDIRGGSKEELKRRTNAISETQKRDLELGRTLKIQGRWYGGGAQVDLRSPTPCLSGLGASMYRRKTR